MSKYTPLTSGLFGPVAVNRKLKQLWDEIDTLKAVIAEMSERKEIEHVELNPEEQTEEEFNWRTSQNATALKDFAFESLGVTIKGNKKPETIRDEIKEFIESQSA